MKGVIALNKKEETNKICAHYATMSAILMAISMLIVVACGYMIASIVRGAVSTWLAILLIIAASYIACVAIMFGMTSTYLCICKAVDKSMNCD